MMYLVKMLSTEKGGKLNRLLAKFLRLGKNDVQTSIIAQPFGDDANPVKDWIAVYSPTSEDGKTVIVGFLNPETLAEVGGRRMYSTDADGKVKALVYLRANGDAELNGSDDNLVRFSKLKETIDELQDDIGALKQAFTSWVPAPTDGGAALKAATGSWFAAPLVKSIDPAKIKNLKTNSDQ